MHTNNDNELMTVQPDEQFLKNYQAVYYAMNAKPDCKSKVFTKRVIVQLSDLKNLNRKITEKFKAHYDDAGFTINVTVSFADHSIVEFNSWTTFEKYDWDDNRVIDNITIKWEYNARLPQYPLPQKHTIVVRLADEISPEEVLNLVVTGKLEEMSKLQQEICPVVTRVEFINSMLAEELINIVAEWQDGLKTRDGEISSCLKFAKKFRRAIAYIINYLTLLLVIVCSFKYFTRTVKSMSVDTLGKMPIESFEKLVVCAAVLIAICWITNKVFENVANVVFTSLGSSRNYHTFDITKGDKNRCNEINNKLKSSKVKIVLNLIFTLLFNIFCSIIANTIQCFL